MTDIFQFDNYREFVRVRIREVFPERAKIEAFARALGADPTLVSQVLGGSRNFSDDHALEIARIFSLDEIESEYFLSLLQMERTSNPGLKKLIRRRIAKLKAEISEMKASNAASDLSEGQKAVYYSNWYFGAIWLAAGLPESRTPEKISSALGLPLEKVQVAVDFLLKSGLLGKKDGLLRPSPKINYIDRSSNYLSRHHLNWRVKALEYVSKSLPENYSFTAPMAISESDAQKIRKMVLGLGSEVQKTIAASEEEEEKLFCLNIDWFCLLE